eukprot:2967832-Amphidinium_carterae.1
MPIPEALLCRIHVAKAVWENPLKDAQGGQLSCAGMGLTMHHLHEKLVLLRAVPFLRSLFAQ